MSKGQRMNAAVEWPDLIWSEMRRGRDRWFCREHRAEMDYESVGRVCLRVSHKKAEGKCKFWESL